MLTLAFLSIGAASASAIPRDATLARGQTWIDARIPYSQSRNYAGYRTDCSGFVSMCWQAATSYNTRTLYRVAYPIGVWDLRPGDALLKANYHVRLFAGWVDAAHTRYVAYEQTTPGAIQSLKYIDADLAQGYIPYRYNRIEDGPAAWNTLPNGTFDVWVGDPVWWSASRDASGSSVARRRTDIRSSSAAALDIVNRSTDPNRFADVSRTVTVEAGRTYSLSAFAWTNRDPSAVRMRLQVLGADGHAVVDTTTTGSSWGVGPADMRQMSISQLIPSGATTATVSLRLAGGLYLSTDTPGSAVFDDVVLNVPWPMPIYRFYNAGAGTHFYTAMPQERDQVVSWLWGTLRYESVAYFVGNSPANNQNLYRFYNPRAGTHFYTASDEERDDVIRRLSSWLRYEGVAYRVSRVPIEGATTVYRFFNIRNGTHFYTASVGERDQVIRTLSGYLHYEGPVFYCAQ